jgi:uncharacterized membrane protein YhaH (DUF805 family)
MTTLTAPAHTSTGPLRALLLVDGVGTAAVGAGALLLAEPLADHVGTPGALRAVGVLFLFVAADMLLARRLHGRRLAAAAGALAGVDLAWAVTTTAALPALDTTGAGTAMVLAVAATCVVMGTGKLALVRRGPRGSRAGLRQTPL